MYNTDLPTRAELPTTGKLLFSTVAAALVAAVFLVTAILPAEYGVDPTGIGRILGLTRMGEIKASLAAEAIPSAGAQPPAIEAVLAEPAESTVESASPRLQHTMTVTLKPGQAAEIKLSMSKDAKTLFEWFTAGGPVNYDTHGDPADAPTGYYHGYGKGRNETRHSGELQAAFDGTHGWFWRNRSEAEVTITLNTNGEYEEIKRVL